MKGNACKGGMIMVNDIDELCGNVSSIGGKKMGIYISEWEVADAREIGERCLVGRIGEERRINKEAFKTVLTCLCRMAGTVIFKDVQENIWIFEFYVIDNKKRIMEGRLWSFD